MKQMNLFTNKKLDFDKSLEILIDSVNPIGAKYDHWVFAWSAGKDSTTLLTIIMSLLDSGQITCRPKTIDVLFADTRAELLPLHASFIQISEQLEKRGVNVTRVMAEMDKRFLVYILGRGVPPPNNNTLRWCTRQIKIDPMQNKIKELSEQYGKKLLSFVGVRQGESAVRDQRIVMSCSADGTECGTGHLYEMLDDDLCDKLAPILHFRTCTVWDWLKVFAPQDKYGGWMTSMIAEAYGDYGENSAEEKNARTGCNACPLASKDKALDTLLLNPYWQYLRPLKKLRTIYDEMRLPKHRLRKPGNVKKKDGTLAKNQNRMGPLTMDARKMFLDQILAIQNEVNVVAKLDGKPMLDILNEEEYNRIIELIELNTWPDGWDGTEPLANEPFVQHFNDGTYQPLLIN